MSEISLPIVLVAAGPDQNRAVVRLAERLSLPVCCVDDRIEGLLLYQGVERLEIRQQGRGAPGPVYVDFVFGKVAHRRKYGGGAGQPLARAVGLKRGVVPDILDVTAGLGRDAFVLATLGCKVRMIERSPIIAALLADGLSRARADLEVREIVQRMPLLNVDGRRYLKALSVEERPAVVYLDPMYPHRAKSAKVRKEMQLLQRLLGGDSDSPELLVAARKVARNRVVVKRPAKAEPLGGLKPSLAIHSPNTRYDIYLAGIGHAAV